MKDDALYSAVWFSAVVVYTCGEAGRFFKVFLLLDEMYVFADIVDVSIAVVIMYKSVS